MAEDKELLNVNANTSGTLSIEEFKHSVKLGREHEEDIYRLEKGLPLDPQKKRVESELKKDID